MTTEDDVLEADLYDASSDDHVDLSSEDEPADGRQEVSRSSAPAQPSERAGMYLAILIALAVPSLIVLAFLLPEQSNSTAGTIESTTQEPSSTGLDELEIDTSLPEEPVDVSVAEVVEESPDIAPVEDATPDPQSIPDQFVGADPDAIEVLVYDESPSVEGEFTFAVRLKNLSITEEIDTQYFTVRVETGEGESTTSRARFVHESLPVNSSAIAAVRAIDSGSDAHFVVVCIGDTEFGRVLIDVA